MKILSVILLIFLSFSLSMKFLKNKNKNSSPFNSYLEIDMKIQFKNEKSNAQNSEKVKIVTGTCASCVPMPDYLNH